MHLRWHAGVPFGILITEKVFGASGMSVTTPYLASTIPALELAPFLALLIGSLFPDVGNFGYKVGGWMYGRSVPIFDSRLWDKKTTRLMAALEDSSWWPSLYKALHSITGNVVFLGTCFLMLPYEIAWYFSIGVGLHLLMDYPSHSINYLWWPWRKTRSRDLSWNWWMDGK